MYERNLGVVHLQGEAGRICRVIVSCQYVHCEHLILSKNHTFIYTYSTNLPARADNFTCQWVQHIARSTGTGDQCRHVQTWISLHNYSLLVMHKRHQLTINRLTSQCHEQGEWKNSFANSFCKYKCVKKKFCLALQSQTPQQTRLAQFQQASRFSQSGQLDRSRHTTQQKKSPTITNNTNLCQPSKLHLSTA